MTSNAKRWDRRTQNVSTRVRAWDTPLDYSSPSGASLPGECIKRGPVSMCLAVLH